MKISDILDRLKQYPPDSELEIRGPIGDNPAMFYIDGTYVLKEFDDE